MSKGHCEKPTPESVPVVAGAGFPGPPSLRNCQIFVSFDCLRSLITVRIGSIQGLSLYLMFLSLRTKPTAGALPKCSAADLRHNSALVALMHGL